MISSSDWKAPNDYKVYCINGDAKYVMVCVGRENDGHPLFLYYDKNWNLMPFSQDAIDNPDLKIEKPKCLDDLFFYANKLSKPFPFVRADFYCVGTKVYFGELTFTPSGGLDNGRLYVTDKILGDLLVLPEVGE